MFRFADPNFLYLLILLPFLVALYLYSNYHRRQNILCSCDIPPNLTNVIKILYILKGYSVNEIKNLTLNPDTF